MLALEMASPGNRHCATQLGWIPLSFPHGMVALIITLRHSNSDTSYNTIHWISRSVVTDD